MGPAESGMVGSNFMWRDDDMSAQYRRQFLWKVSSAMMSSNEMKPCGLSASGIWNARFDDVRT